MKYLCTILLGLVTAFASAQGWSVSSKAVDMQFGDVVYMETVWSIKGHPKPDTLPGTGFLLTRDSIVYLVTTKHQILPALRKNGWLRIGRWYNKRVKVLPFDLKSNRKAWLLDPKNDIAIISLKKKPQVLNFFLKHDASPVPVDSLDVSGNHTGRESFFLTSYQSYYYKWARHVTVGLSPGTIIAYKNSPATFTIDHDMLVSFSGAPIFKDDHIIGMVTHPMGLNSLDAYLKNAYQKTESAVAIKSEYILQLLNRLQHQQLNHNLNYPTENIPKISPLPIKGRN